MADSGVLLVPVKVDALMVNVKVRETDQINFRRFQMVYENLQQTLQSPEPEPFSGESDFCGNPENDGVYLHWELPDALKHGIQQKAGGPVSFPLVPNRWLVVRYHEVLNTVKAWIIESDFLDPIKGTSPFLDPAKTDYSELQTDIVTRIGRSIELENWTETNKPLFLTAIGTGNVTFSAFQPNVGNVFSFFDQLVHKDPATGNLSRLDPGTLSYLVAGWYSDSTKDILKQQAEGASFQDLLNELRWAMPSGGAWSSGGVYTSAGCSVYHGVVCGISWDEDGALPPNHYPDRDKASVTVGNTSIDALTALIKAQVGSQTKMDAINAELLEAFQYNLLGSLAEPGGLEKLARTIRQSWFGSTPGGVLWDIINKESNVNSFAKQAGNNANPLPAGDDDELSVAEEQILCGLNSGQAKFDSDQRLLHSLQKELHALWWVKEYLKLNGQDYAQVFAKMTASVQGVLERFAQVEDDQKAIPVGDDPQAFAASIAEYAKNHNLPEYRELKPAAMPRFWQPVDPVLLITGLNTSPISEIGSVLSCRYSDQVITRLTYDGISQGITNPPVLNLGNLPALIIDAVKALYQEFLILAPVIVKKRFQPIDPKRLVYDKTLPFLGLDAWMQPWKPLFMEWQITWYPVPYQYNTTDNWLFDGAEYRYNANNSIAKAILEDSYKTKGRVLSGRTFLTSQAIYTFKSRLEKFLQDHKSSPLQPVEDFINSMKDWDILSQRLSGFNDQLLMSDPTTNVAPDNHNLFKNTGKTMAQLIGDQHHTTPMTGRSNFQPMRGGQFKIERLAVIDGFGQSVDLIGNFNNYHYHPIVAAGLQPQLAMDDVEPLRFVQLPPRPLQGARLNFNYVSATDDTKVLNLDTGVNPVCGWIIPNHLDTGLSVYDVTGLSLGELSPDGNETALIWEAAPGSPFNDLQSLTAQHRHLGEILTGLMNTGMQGFTAMLSTIDETLWTVDPLGERYDQNLSVLMGRPLAVVRCKLQFELDSPPLKDLSVDGITNGKETDFSRANFTLKLGNYELREDGLIGYFLNNDYTRFYAVHIPDTGEPAAYISQIGTIQPDGKGTYIYLPLGGSIAAFVTMLIDPRAVVHAYTGILPERTLSLPSRYITKALSQMVVTFKTGPLLTDATTPNVVRMPLPAEKNGKWTWVEKAAGGWEPGFEVATTDQKAAIGTTPPVLKEGLLKLAIDLEQKGKR